MFVFCTIYNTWLYESLLYCNVIPVLSYCAPSSINSGQPTLPCGTHFISRIYLQLCTQSWLDSLLDKQFVICKMTLFYIFTVLTHHPQISVSHKLILSRVPMMLHIAHVAFTHLNVPPQMHREQLQLEGSMLKYKNVRQLLHWLKTFNFLVVVLTNGA